MNNNIKEIMSILKSSENKVKIKLLGDSITHGVGGMGFQQSGSPIVKGYARNPDGHCWANTLKNYLESNYNCELTNNACTGTRIEFIIENLNELILPDDDIVIITIGTNNRHKYFSEGPRPCREQYLTEFENNIEKLHLLTKDMNNEVIFVINVPAGKSCEGDGADYWRIFHMPDVREAYFKIQKKHGFPLIDLYRLFIEYSEERNMRFEELLADGLHPNDKGHDAIFEILIGEFGL